jgi:phosphoribosylanthranilate isomerase
MSSQPVQVPQVKICGLSTAETMEAALAAGADFVGLVFFPRSPRNVSPEQAMPLAGQARGRAKIVALVVDADDALLAALAETVKPDFIQAHGAETPERVAEITRRTGIPVIKAIRVKDAADIASAAAYSEAASLILYDAKAPETLTQALPGGNGHAFDWGLLETARRPAFMLAGGLNPDNVAEAIRITGAPVVDVSSGVESAPGVKDVELIRKFIEAARSAR